MTKSQKALARYTVYVLCITSCSGWLIINLKLFVFHLGEDKVFVRTEVSSKPDGSEHNFSFNWDYGGLSNTIDATINVPNHKTVVAKAKINTHYMEHMTVDTKVERDGSFTNLLC